MTLPKLGELRIAHLGYGFLAEMRWTEKGWLTVRSDGPYMSAFTDEERMAHRLSATSQEKTR